MSFGKDGDEVPPELWKRVWSLQLRLKGEGQFWQGVEGAPVEYDVLPAPPSPAALPDYLLRFLRDTLHYPDDHITSLDRERAQDLLNAYYAGALRQPPARDPSQQDE